MNSKIMNTSNLEDISLRLTCCAATLRVIHEKMSGMGELCDLCDALYGVQNFLCVITKDFDADIAGAADYEEVRT